jgi:hypothetical protein
MPIGCQEASRKELTARAADAVECRPFRLLPQGRSVPRKRGRPVSGEH